MPPGTSLNCTVNGTVQLFVIPPGAFFIVGAAYPDDGSLAAQASGYIMSNAWCSPETYVFVALMDWNASAEIETEGTVMQMTSQVDSADPLGCFGTNFEWQNTRAENAHVYLTQQCIFSISTANCTGAIAFDIPYASPPPPLPPPLPPPSPPSPAFNLDGFLCASGCDASVCRALGELYGATAGPMWLNASGWREAAHSLRPSYCAFHGITCDSGGVRDAAGLAVCGNVVSIRLHSNGLLADFGDENGIVTALANISSLSGVDFSSNLLYGSIPSSIASLAMLTSLSLAGNALSSSVPDELGQLTWLSRLDLSRSQLTGSLPASLGLLTSLQYLSVADAGFQGSLPQLDGFSNLTALLASGNSFSGLVPATYGSLSALELLSLADNSLSGSLPYSLASLPALQLFNASLNTLTGVIPDGWENVTAFDVRLNQLEGTIPSQLGIGGLITYAGLSYNRLGGQVPAGLSEVCASHSVDLFPQQSYALGMQLTGGSALVSDSYALAAAFSNECVTSVVLTANITIVAQFSFTRKMVQLSSDCTTTAWSRCALSASFSSRHFALTHSYLQLSSVILTNGLISSGVLGGGSILADKRSYIVIQDSWLYGNVASGQAGGAILSNGAPVNVTAGSRLTGNKAARGGAITLSASPTGDYPPLVSLENCIMSGNAALLGDGGAVFISRGTQGLVLARNSTFAQNTAKYSGGAVSVESAEFIDCSFDDNSANATVVAISSGGGGALFTSGNSSRQVTLTGCMFSGNTAPYAFGGAVLALLDLVAAADMNCWVNVSDSAFALNAAASGGALALHGLQASLEGLQLYRNLASLGQGGALIVDQMQYLLVEASQFVKNNATSGGAAAVMCNTYTSACPASHLFSGTNFSSNAALDYGGAVVSDTFMSGTSFSGCFFENNTAVNAGGAAYGDAMEVLGCVFSANTACFGSGGATARRGGGSLFASGSVGLSVSESVFDGSSCSGIGAGEDHGGAILADYSADAEHGAAVILTSSNFTNNRAVGGGAVALISLRVTIVGCFFDNATAFGELGGPRVGVGGALQLLNPTRLSIEGTIISNSGAAVQGGAAAHLFIPQPPLYSSPACPSTSIYNASTLFNNTATSQGGAVYIAGCKLQFVDSSIVNNTVLGESAQGGGVYADDSSCQTDSIAVCSRAPDLTFANTSIAGNTVTLLQPLKLPGTSYFVRYAQGYGGGGAIVLSGTSNLLPSARIAFLNNSLVVDNTAESGAGFFMEGDLRTTISNSTFGGNVASSFGGGLFVRLEAGTLITDPTSPPALLANGAAFLANAAEAGGGAYVEGILPVSVNTTLFAANTAHDDGGALLVTNGNATLRNCTFLENSADRGAALSTYPGSRLSLVLDTFKSNVATTGGPVLMLNALSRTPGAVSLRNLTSVDNNSTGGYGGAFGLTDAMTPFPMPACIACVITTWSGQPPPLAMGGNRTFVSAPRTYLLSANTDPALNPKLNPKLTCPPYAQQHRLPCVHVFSTVGLPAVCVTLWDIFNHSVSAWPASVEASATRVFPNVTTTSLQVGITSDSLTAAAYTAGASCLGGSTTKLALADDIGTVYQVRYSLVSNALPVLLGPAAALSNAAMMGSFGSVAVEMQACRPRETFSNFVCVCSVGAFLDLTMAPPTCQPCQMGFYKPTLGSLPCLMNSVGRVSVFQSTFQFSLSWTPWLGYPGSAEVALLERALAAGFPAAAVNISDAVGVVGGVEGLTVVLSTIKDAGSTDWSVVKSLRANFTSRRFNNSVAALLTAVPDLSNFTFSVAVDPSTFELNMTLGEEPCAANYQVNPATGFCNPCPLGFQSNPGESCVALPTTKGLATVFNVSTTTLLSTSSSVSAFDLLPGGTTFLHMLNTYASILGVDPTTWERSAGPLPGVYTYTSPVGVKVAIADFTLTMPSSSGARRLTAADSSISVAFVNRPIGDAAAAASSATLGNVTKETYAEHGAPIEVTAATPPHVVTVQTSDLSSFLCPPSQYMHANVSTGEPARCLPCAAGFYSLGGVDACTPCPVGQHGAGDETNRYCVSCPSDSNSNFGCSDISCCLCKYGTYPLYNATGSTVFTCAGCPYGAVCDSLLFAAGITAVPLAKKDFWHVAGDRTEFYECEEERCEQESVEQYLKELMIMSRNQTWDYFAAVAGAYGEGVENANCRGARR